MPMLGTLSWNINHLSSLNVQFLRKLQIRITLRSYTERGKGFEVFLYLCDTNFKLQTAIFLLKNKFLYESITTSENLS